jgi:hypothetical protein
MPKPEWLLSDNPYGKIFFGPGANPKKDPGLQYTISLTNGYNETHTKTGNKGEIVRGTSHEIVKGQKPGDNRKKKEDENTTKSIVVEEGDLVLHAINGNIKLIAKNVFIETTGSGNDGSFMVKANEAITMTAGEQMTLGGAKICMSTPDSITFNADGIIYMLCKDISKGSPLAGVLGSLIPGPVKDLIDGIALSCK